MKKFAQSVFWFVWFLPRNAAILFMRLYRKIVSPLYGEVCKYYPSCSRYALESFQEKGFIKATFLSAWRVIKCNPWSHGGIDDVKPEKKKNYRVNQFGIVVWSGSARVNTDET